MAHRSAAIRAAILIGILAWGGRAQAPAVGDVAPSFELEAWTNLPANLKVPTADALKGRVVLIEFWGTWCAPCVRAMPRIQALHDRFKDRGLTVLGISYEPLDKTKPFVQKEGYSFAIGSDPAKRVVEAYGVRSWPTSIVIGKDGKVAHVGDPYSAETAVESALGLETKAAKILTNALDALASKDKKRIREELGRIAEKETLELDLKAWALELGGAAKGDEKPSTSFDAHAELAKLAQAWIAKDEARKKALLDLLAGKAPVEFDATPWAKKAYGKEVPITKEEYAALLKAQRYDEAVDVLYLRSPPPAVVAAATQDKGLKEHCGKKAADARLEAKKALMCGDYVLAGRQPKDNDGYWKELSVSGMRTSEDRKRITGVLLGDGTVGVSNAAFYVERHLARSFVMEALSAGKEPSIGALPEKVRKERDEMRKVLDRKYAPDP